jgi:hypothetical protein
MSVFVKVLFHSLDWLGWAMKVFFIVGILAIAAGLLLIAWADYTGQIKDYMCMCPDGGSPSYGAA